MLLPALADLRDNNHNWTIFLYPCAITTVLATLILLATRGATCRFSTRLSFTLTLCLWLTGSIVAALPFYLSSLPISLAGAIFESISGITTTGSTVITGLDHLSRSILLWRSIICWIGGIGFIGLALILLPSLRVGGIQLFHMESSDKSEKILPRIHQIANGIIIAYIGLTLACMLSYFAAGMTLFDAINHAMTTIATAGFSTHDTSFGYFSDKPAILIVATIFMLLSALPFVLYIKLLLPGYSKRSIDPQVIVFLSIVFLFSFALATWLRFHNHLPFHKIFLDVIFHLTSVISTTGYSAEDYQLWGPFALGIFFIVSFMGGCAGSTSGGIKVNRLIILWRIAQTNMTQLLSPNAIVKVRYDHSNVSNDITKAVLLFLCLYMFCLLIGTALLLTTGLDFTSACTGALTALSNIGPGLGSIIGPVGNFSTINDQALWILSALMLAGRLEIITIFVLFTRSFWNEQF
ncbi:TrkH family potassium uptake protein [Bartonella sp. AR 15-3]|uniref:TrkH family potassium uptake protein n=1 Tax=Bartonella sp. AR 15-3 TaxID=545617 RepID=UPI0001F4C4D3|nr:TrkH family potassium uptake protein [Bartonella sp. AR 15-3]OPB32060.1 trk system potassium uptake protein TrkH [Bartonella sp. AR 15-3]CBI78893.1 trk system potassium uptake protein TrkH [Bartonella sp. AR 15-3]